MHPSSLADARQLDEQAGAPAPDRTRARRFVAPDAPRSTTMVPCGSRCSLPYSVPAVVARAAAWRGRVEGCRCSSAGSPTAVSPTSAAGASVVSGIAAASARFRRPTSAPSSVARARRAAGPRRSARGRVPARCPAPTTPAAVLATRPRATAPTTPLAAERRSASRSRAAAPGSCAVSPAACPMTTVWIRARPAISRRRAASPRPAPLQRTARSTSIVSTLVACGVRAPTISIATGSASSISVSPVRSASAACRLRDPSADVTRGGRARA